MPEGIILMFVALVGWYSAEHLAEVNHIPGRGGALAYRMVAIAFGAAGIYLLVVQT